MSDIEKNQHQSRPTKRKKLRFTPLLPRIGAHIIDALVMAPIGIVGALNLFSFKSVILAQVLAILSMLYKPLFEWKLGATPGKMLLKIKVVDEKLELLSHYQALKRATPWILGTAIGLLVNVSMFRMPAFQEVSNYIEFTEFIREFSSPIQSFQFVYNFIWIALIVGIITDKRKRGFHDTFAGSFCIDRRSIDRYLADPDRPSIEEVMSVDGP